MILSVSPENASFSLESRSGTKLLAASPSYGSIFRIASDSEVFSFRERAQTVRISSSQESLILVYQLPGIGIASLAFYQEPSGAIALFARLQNESRSEYRLQLILDTIAGESSGNHFYRANQALIREFSYTSADGVSMGLFSGQRDREGLYVNPRRPEGGEFPLTLAGANIRRLSESTGNFSVNSNRNFNLLPFSVNDSALMLSRAVAGATTDSMAVSFHLQNSEQTPPDILGTLPNPPTNVGTVYAIAEAGIELDTTGTQLEPDKFSPSLSEETMRELGDLGRIDDVIRRIDSYLAAGAANAEEIAYLRTLLSEIRRSSGL